MFDILFAYIFSIYGNEYGCKMIKKIDILGIQLDNYTVREAIMRVEAWYDNNMLNVIEMVSMQMLTESESDPVLKEVISSLDLAVIGEKGILQAAGVDTMQRIRETEENDFSDEFAEKLADDFEEVWSATANLFLLLERHRELLMNLHRNSERNTRNWC